MNPELTRAGVQIGCLLVIPSMILLLLLDPGTAEFVLMVMTLVIGLVFLGAMVALAIWNQR